MTPLQQVCHDWSDCKRCNLHKGRIQVVEWRGQVPCDVLFIGESPGKSENVLGRPFVGPAGKLQDQINENACMSVERSPKIAFINLVGCIPLDEHGKKTAEPLPEEMRACAPRVKRLIALCRPKLIVCVGKLAQDWVRKLSKEYGITDSLFLTLVDIVHPSAILQAPIANQGLMAQKSVVTLSNAVEDLV